MVSDWVAAWPGGDRGRLAGLLADEVAVECNLTRATTRAALLDTVCRLAADLAVVTLVSRSVAAGRAALVYDCRTSDPVGVVRLAEFLDTEAGRLVAVRRVYDRAAAARLLPRLLP